jgi:hypothetical protein
LQKKKKKKKEKIHYHSKKELEKKLRKIYELKQIAYLHTNTVMRKKKNIYRNTFLAD